MMKKAKIETVKMDILKEKEEQLTRLNARSTSAVDLVTRTISDLENVNSEIATTMADIDTYQEKLSATKGDLSATLNKNSKVVKNFKALLELD